jgi:hypothetical protein
MRKGSVKDLVARLEMAQAKDEAVSGAMQRRPQVMAKLRNDLKQEDGKREGNAENRTVVLKCRKCSSSGSFVSSQAQLDLEEAKDVLSALMTRREQLERDIKLGRMDQSQYVSLLERAIRREQKRTQEFRRRNQMHEYQNAAERCKAMQAEMSKGGEYIYIASTYLHL